MASPMLSESKHLHLEGLQREVEFLQSENQLLEGFLQRVGCEEATIMACLLCTDHCLLQVAASLLASVDEERQVQLTSSLL